MSLATNRALSFARRDVAKLVAFGAVLATFPVRAALSGSASRSGPVVGFYNDAPWLDPVGRDMPYVPPIGVGTPAPDCESLMRLGHFL